MSDTSLIGRCGLYCGHCSIHRAYKDSERLRGEFAKLYGCTPEEIKCDGCQTVNGYSWCKEAKWGKNCKMIKCLDSKGLTYCNECPEFDTCAMFNEFAADNLKIGVDVKVNLAAIKCKKPEEWLSEQEKIWRCRECGNPVINSELVKSCHWCGAKVTF